MATDTFPAQDVGNAGGRTEEAVKQLCGWICHNYGYKDPLTHLKLQKLFFYCYGALLAKDLESEIGPQLVFEPWEHGPVNRELYQLFRNQGSAPIKKENCPAASSYTKVATQTLIDVLTVYGAMSAWSLRQQTHTEKPWQTAYENKDEVIDPVYLKKFFKNKFAAGSVAAPEYLFGLSSFAIDGIPVQNYPSLHNLAETVDRVFSGFKNSR